MKKMVLYAALALVLQACTATQEAPANPSSSSEQVIACPNTGAELDNLKTEQQVIKCFGKSSTVTSKPDGRHTALYEIKKGVLLVFLFDKDGAVIRNRVYQDNGAQ